MVRKVQDKKNTPMVVKKFEAITWQIARIVAGEEDQCFTMKELKAMQQELLDEING